MSTCFFLYRKVSAAACCLKTRAGGITPSKSHISSSSAAFPCLLQPTKSPDSFLIPSSLGNKTQRFDLPTLKTLEPLGTEGRGGLDQKTLSESFLVGRIGAHGAGRRSPPLLFAFRALGKKLLGSNLSVFSTKAMESPEA